MIIVTGLFISILFQGGALLLARRRQNLRRTEEDLSALATFLIEN